jgi:hypothetical protein
MWPKSSSSFPGNLNLGFTWRTILVVLQLEKMRKKVYQIIICASPVLLAGAGLTPVCLVGGIQTTGGAGTPVLIGVIVISWLGYFWRYTHHWRMYSSLDSVIYKVDSQHLFRCSVSIHNVP